MRPLTLSERQRQASTVGLSDLLQGAATVHGSCTLDLVDYVDEILGSGFPGIRALPEPRPRGPARQLRPSRCRSRSSGDGLHGSAPGGSAVLAPRYAAAVGTTTAWEKIRDAATPGVGNKPAKSDNDRATPSYSPPSGSWTPFRPGSRHRTISADSPRHRNTTLPIPRFAGPSVAPNPGPICCTETKAGWRYPEMARSSAACSSPWRRCPSAATPKRPTVRCPTSVQKGATTRWTSSWRAGGEFSPWRPSWLRTSTTPTCAIWCGFGSGSASDSLMPWC